MQVTCLGKSLGSWGEGLSLLSTCCTYKCTLLDWSPCHGRQLLRTQPQDHLAACAADPAPLTLPWSIVSAYVTSASTGHVLFQQVFESPFLFKCMIVLFLTAPTYTHLWGLTPCFDMHTYGVIKTNWHIHYYLLFFYDENFETYSYLEI